jgi:hypothetical protein
MDAATFPAVDAGVSADVIFIIFLLGVFQLQHTLSFMSTDYLPGFWNKYRCQVTGKRGTREGHNPGLTREWALVNAIELPIFKE